ncbi:MAG: hypothetical protein ACYC5Y_05250 [Symbiobacteriia bacterium]
MPAETQTAVDWALTQTDSNGQPIAAQNDQALVDHVRQYFNDHAVAYTTFSYDDLKPYLPA